MSTRSPLTLRLASAAVLTVALVATVTPTAAGTAQKPWQATTVNITVPVGVSGITSAKIHAVQYTPAQPIRGIQVFIPGSTYDHHYFDLPTDRGLVSQARKAARDGWVAIALDRIGTGGSSKPPATDVTTAAHIASVDHFVNVIDRRYHQLPITLVGHSYGSVVAEGVAARSRVVDALVVTGFLYRRTPPSFDGFPTLVPAATDPILKDKRLPKGYLTTTPGSRGFFYYLPNASRSTLAADERFKSTTTAVETTGFGQELQTRALAGRVRVPVLVVEGAQDYLSRGNDPANFPADQRQAFHQAASVRAVLIPRAGHDLALQRNAATTVALIDRWAASHTRAKHGSGS